MSINEVQDEVIAEFNDFDNWIGPLSAPHRFRK